ncbi:MAG: metallophosphoesterase [Opitutaceae bacterium]|jgi:predicted phosphodiesterase|nr:metallophosphoesterase [Opitutaceae bacterium]
MKSSFILFAAILAAPAPAAPPPLVDAGFEQTLPPGADLNHLAAVTDTTRAHSGRASLRVTSAPKATWGYLAFELDGKLDFDANYEFSVQVFTADTKKISLYLSSDAGDGERCIYASGNGDIVPGQWCKLSGFMFAGDWRRRDRSHRFILRVNGTCWIDDLALRPVPAETPAQVWPGLKTALHAAAARRATTLAPGATVTLDASRAALAPDTARLEVTLPAPQSGAATPPANPAPAGLIIPAEGLLVFAIDAADDLDLTGTLELHHTAAPAPSAAGFPSSASGPPALSLAPGLRATILADDTVIAAPAVRAAPWHAVRVQRGGHGVFALPAGLAGERPASTVPLAPFRLAKGRRHLAIAGPHIRDAGTFVRLDLAAAPRPAEKPLHTFALLSDTHLGFNRREWRNTLLGSATGAGLEAVLRDLKREGAAYAIIAGDLTDDARRAEYQDLAGIIGRAALPVYGCIGNHDTARDSRAGIAATIPHLFPAGPKNTDYAFNRPPLRFIVLDGSHWRDPAGKIHDHQKQKKAGSLTLRDGAHDWLRDTLAADTVTPTILVSHYPFYFARGVSPVTGYDRGKPFNDEKLTRILDAAPNVIAALSGHLHHNETAVRNGITYLQNPAFAEWPDAYRVFRVYKDRLEWEVRQLPNRGLLREGVIPETALLWQLSTDPGDLAGAIPLAKNKNARPLF